MSHVFNEGEEVTGVQESRSEHGLHTDTNEVVKWEDSDTRCVLTRKDKPILASNLYEMYHINLHGTTYTQLRLWHCDVHPLVVLGFHQGIPLSTLFSHLRSNVFVPLVFNLLYTNISAKDFFMPRTRALRMLLVAHPIKTRIPSADMVQLLTLCRPFDAATWEAHERQK